MGKIVCWTSQSFTSGNKLTIYCGYVASDLSGESPMNDKSGLPSTTHQWTTDPQQFELKLGRKLSNPSAHGQDERIPHLPASRQNPLVRTPSLDSILRVREIECLTGRHRTTIHRWVRDGLFPAKLKMQELPVGWRRSEVELWLSGQWNPNRPPNHIALPRARGPSTVHYS